MQTAQRSNWKGRKVFVTGGTGFLGTHLCKRLELMGARLGLFIHKRQSPVSASRIKGDLRVHTDDLFHFLTGFNPEIIFHLASQPLVSVAQLDELETIETNVAGTYNLLNAVKKLHGVKAFVHISTDKVYGNVSPITKDTVALGLHHPYNTSKLASDHTAQMYSNFYNIPTVVIRNANVYGAGDIHMDRIIPRTIRNAYLGEPPVIRGDGSNTRDYIHVDDLINGYITAVDVAQSGPTVLNLSGFNHSVLDVVDTVLAKMGRVDLAPKFESQWKGEIPHQHIVNDRAKELIGWEPKIDLDEGLDRTIPWYREMLSGH